MEKNIGTGATVAGEFTDGGAGEQRSVLGARWLNMIQRELIAVVEGAGLVLNGAVFTQLLQAIRNLGFDTGDAKITMRTVAVPGWIMVNDGTIGDATSGATTRANADCQALYTMVWNNVIDAWAPVTGGRGASAAADWAAHKPIALPKQLGRALAVAGAGAGLTARALGETHGAEAVQLTEPQLPKHKHPMRRSGSGGNLNVGGNTDRYVGTGGTTGYNESTEEAGNDEAHPNMQPSAFWNVMVKL
jgi:hypothetical protein